MGAALAALMLLASGSARAQDAPHVWRVGVAMGVGGAPDVAESEVVEQLREALYEPDVAWTAEIACERWLDRAMGAGVGAWWHRLVLSRADVDSPTRLDTVALLIHGVAAVRGNPSAAGGEAGVELSAGPAYVRWEHRDESVGSLGLALRLAARVGQGLANGFTWSLRPWLGTVIASVGPNDLSTAGLYAGVDLYAGWGW